MRRKTDQICSHDNYLFARPVAVSARMASSCVEADGIRLDCSGIVDADCLVSTGLAYPGSPTPLPTGGCVDFRAPGEESI